MLDEPDINLDFAVLILIVTLNSPTITFMENTTRHKVNVWDTYVTKKNGTIMHFDIIAPVEITDTRTIYNYGKEYLKSKGQEGQPLDSRQCRLCHIEILKPEWKDDIADKGYFIIEMEGCK